MDEPNYRLTDASGNVIGDIGVDANGNPTVEHADSGESVSITEDGLVAKSLSASASITDPSGATHTGELADLTDTQTQDEVEDIISSLLSGGANITVNYDDANDVLAVDTSALNQEEVEDAVSGLVAVDSNLTVNYDDADNSLSVGLANDVTVDSLSTERAVSKTLNNNTPANVPQGGQKHPPSAHLEEYSAGAITGAREKFWVLKNGPSDYEGFVTRGGDVDRYLSNDGVTWSSDSNNPVISESSITLQDCCVIRDDGGLIGAAGTYYLYVENSSSATDIRIYTSSDGLSWTYQNSFSANAPQSPVAHLRGDGTVVLAYEKFNSLPYWIGHAVSSDGINFTDQGQLVESYNWVCDDWYYADGRWWMTGHISGGGEMIVTHSDTEFGTYQGDISVLETSTATNTTVESYTVPHTPSGGWAGDIKGLRLAYGWAPNDNVINVYKQTSSFRGDNTAHTLPSGAVDTTDMEQLAAYLVPDPDTETLIDLSGNQSSGVVNDAAVVNDSNLGAPVIEFAGTESKVASTGYRDSFRATDFTIGVICKPDVASGLDVALGRFGSNGEMKLGQENGNWMVKVWDGGSGLTATGSTVTGGEYVSLFGTWDDDSDELNLFLNGSNDATASQSGFELNYTPWEIAIGGDRLVPRDDRVWKGRIAAAFVYPNRILPDATIKSIHDMWLTS